MIVHAFLDHNRDGDRPDLDDIKSFTENALSHPGSLLEYAHDVCLTVGGCECLGDVLVLYSPDVSDIGKIKRRFRGLL